jgi:(p)ppGpp synthase/HD superfamily hydrolase
VPELPIGARLASAAQGNLARVGGIDPPTVEDAIALAAKAHRGQRYASPEAEPYVFHPLRVMLRFTDAVEQIASVLHDAIEDTDLTIDDLVRAGYTADVVDVIDCLTHRDDESYDDYIDRVARNGVARRVDRRPQREPRERPSLAEQLSERRTDRAV